MDSRFLSRETFVAVDDLSLDETLAQYASESDKYQEIVLILLQGTIGEGLMGAGELFDKGALFKERYLMLLNVWNRARG